MTQETSVWYNKNTVFNGGTVVVQCSIGILSMDVMGK